MYSTSSSEEDEEDDGIIWNQPLSIGDNEKTETNTICLDHDNCKAEPKADQPTSRKRKRADGRRVELEKRMQLLIKMARIMKWNVLCDIESVNFQQKMPQPFQHIDCLQRLNLLVQWFKNTFVIDTQEVSSVSCLKHAFKVFKGSAIEAVLVFVCLCRSEGIPCRLVSGFGSGTITCKCWVEVLIPDDRIQWPNWVPVYFGDMPELRYTYVVALNACNFSVDVTRRYSERWTKTAKNRFDDSNGWWSIFIIGALQSEALQNLSINLYGFRTLVLEKFRMAVSQNMVQHEEREFEHLVFNEKLPESLDGFKNHPKYILERQVGQGQCLHTNAESVGYFKKDRIFLRADVQEALSETGWRKRGRIVVADIENPIKTILRTSKTGNVDHRKLYGFFQTEEYTPIPLGQDDLIPKSEYGNIDIWTSSCVPVGAVHLRVGMAAEAARELNIDFAPAMVGFERRDGKAVAILDGIVLLTKYVDIVSDAAASISQMRILEVQQKRLEKVRSRWEKFTKHLVRTSQLMKKFKFNDKECVHSFSIVSSMSTCDGGTLQSHRCSICGLCRNVESI